MASLALGSVGSALLGPIGGFIGSAVGSYIDNLLFSPTPDDIEGPRLSDLSATRADPGVPIPLTFGVDRIPGIITHTTEIIETKHKKKVGGKGGGGKKQQEISYTYHVDISYMLCEGPIIGVGRIWSDGKLIRGTRYQLEVDTDANFEKVSGIPYPDYYKDHSYAAADVFWSNDPNYNTGISSLQKYARQDDPLAFEAISDLEAEDILENTVDCVYMYDATRKKYLPTPESHGYTGEVVPDSVPTPIFEEMLLPLPSITIGGSEGGFTNTKAQYYAVPLAGVGGGFQVPSVGGPIGSASYSASLSSEMVSEFADFGYATSYVITLQSGHASFQDEELTPGPTDNTALAMSETDAISSASFSTSTPATDNAGGPSSPQTVKAKDSVPLYAGTTHVMFRVEMTKIALNLDAAHINKEGGDLLTVAWSYLEPAPGYRDWQHYFNFYDAINDWSPRAVLQFNGPEGVSLYRGTDDQIADPTMAAISITGDVPAYTCRAHIVFQRLELAVFGNRVPSLTFEVVQGDKTQAKDIIEALLYRSGIESTNYDTSALPSEGVDTFVQGYSIASITSYRAAMEPIMEAFKIDAAEIGRELIFRPKHREPDHTIDYSDLAAIATGDSNGEPLRLTFRDTVEMPRSISVRFKDPEREYQTNTASFTRQIGRSTQTSVIEIPGVFEPSRMKALARDKMRDLWMERTAGDWSLQHKYIHISPTDIVTIDGSAIGKETSTFKVSQVTRRSDGIMELEGVLRDQELYVPADGETDDTGVDTSIYRSQYVYGLAYITRAEYLDIPPLLDINETTNYNASGIYYAPTGTKQGWPGVSLHRDTNLDSSIVDLVSVSLHYIGATVGTAIGYNNALDNDVPMGSLDTTSRLTVYLHNEDDQLESVTVSELFNGANAALVGDEIVAFQKAEVQPDGGYVLSNFLRARLDTIDKATDHSDGERFVLLASTSTYDVPLPIELTGETIDFYSVTFGNASNPNNYNDDGDFLSLAHGNGRVNYTARRLRPFRPVQIAATRDIDDNIAITWVRQDRLDRGVYNLRDISNTDVNTFTLEIWTVQNPIEALTGLANTERKLREVMLVDQVDGARGFEYTEAMQRADGHPVGDPVTVRIYQHSANVGTGNIGQGTV